MRRKRGECLLASCAAMGCMMVVAGVALVGLWYYLRPRPSNVRPMVHQTPARTVQVSAPAPAATPTPEIEKTPLPQDFAATISADGYMPGMSKAVVKPNKRLIFKGDKLVEVLDAKTLQIDEHQLKAGDAIELAQLRGLLPTRRESQKSERDGSVRHSFPQPGGLEVQVWLRNGLAQKFALIMTDR